MTTITIVGRAVQDCELRFTSSGKAVAEINLADNHRKRDGDEWVDDGTTFYRVTAWDHLAQECADKIRSGERVIIVGDLRNREYEKDGEKRRSLEIRAYEVAPLLDKYPPRDGNRSEVPNSSDTAWTGGATSANQEPPF